MSLMPLYAGVRIVVLGSSTAAGAGVQNASNAWVNRYQAYLQTLDPTNQVINLAKGGYTTCAIMPTGTPDYNTGSNILSVDTERNIDKALSYDPGAIIINMPTNDVSNGIPVDTQMEHFKTVIDMAEVAGVKVWITTSQPHNFGEDYDGPYGNGKEPDVWKQTARDQFKELTEKILETYGERAIDFYTDIATEDGYSFIRPEYDSGDGVHLNDAAHAVLFEKVKEKNILSQIERAIHRFFCFSIDRLCRHIDDFERDACEWFYACRRKWRGFFHYGNGRQNIHEQFQFQFGRSACRSVCWLKPESSV